MSALPPGVAWLVRRVAPRRRAAELVRDLDEDYADVRRRQSRARARWWLTREAASLLAAYLAAPLARLPDQIPILTRDLRLVGRGLRRGALPAAGAAAMLSTGLLALLLTAGLAQTLLFREVSATHGEALRRIAVQEREGGSTTAARLPRAAGDPRAPRGRGGGDRREHAAGRVTRPSGPTCRRWPRSSTDGTSR